MAGAVLGVGAFIQQEALDPGGATEDKLAVAGRLQDALLHHPQLDFQDTLQVLGLEHLEDHDLVDAVHELRRKLALGGILGRAGNLFVEPVVDEGRLLGKAHGAVNQLVHLARTQV